MVKAMASRIEACVALAILLQAVPQAAWATPEYLDYSPYYHHLAVSSAYGATSLVYDSPLLFVGGKSVMGDSAAVHILDLSQPDLPVELSLFSLDATPSTICGQRRSGDLLFVSCDYGLFALDLSNLEQPQLLSALPLSYKGELRISGNTLVIAGGRRGIALVDVTNPLAPVPRGTLQTVDASGIAVNDTLLYVADGRGGLELISIADPEHPRRQHITSLEDKTFDVELFDGYAAVTHQDAGIATIDVSNPLDWQRLMGESAPASVFRLSRQGNRLLTVDGGYYRGMHIYDMSNPSMPVEVEEYPAGHVQDAVFADSALVTANPTGVVLDRRVPPVAAPTIGSAQLGNGSTPQAIQGWGDKLFVAGVGGVEVFDATDPRDAQSIARFLYGVSCTGLVLDNDLAFVTGAGIGLVIYDVSDLTQLRQLSAAPATSTATALAVGQSLCALALHEHDLQILDVSDPTQPRAVGYLDVGSSISKLGFGPGRVLVVGTAADGVLLVDCSDPATPTPVGSIARSEAPESIEIRGNIAHILFRNVGYIIVDISNPWAPEILSSVGTPTSGHALGVGGDYAYLRCHNEGVQILDVADPSRPRWVGAVNSVTLQDASALWAGPEWFCAGRWSSLEFGYLPLDAAIAANRKAPRAPGRIHLAAYPNPGNPTFNIELALDRAQRVRLTVQAVNGRHCATLDDSRLDPGLHRFVWDGRRDDGRLVASGVYLLRAEAETMDLSARLVLVK